MDTCLSSTDAADDRMPMTIGERTTWCYGILVVIATIVYFAVVLPQIGASPATVNWQLPMLIAIGGVIAGTVLATIVGTIVTAIIRRDTQVDADIRDKQIDRHGERSTMAVAGIGTAAVLVLVMLELDPLWIGSALFAVGAISAIWGSVAKIRAYRRFFHG